MNDQEIAWPVKAHELIDGLMDSTVWNDIDFRDDDIVIATYGKAGTTWLQQIVAQLIFGGQDMPVGELSPWVEFRMFPKEATLGILEKQTHRRFMKTHLPVDALVFSPNVKYIYVARDGRDVLWSYHKFMSGFGAPPPQLQALIDAGKAEAPQPPNPDIRAFYHEWLDKDGYPFHPFFAHVQGWWDIRHLPNVLLLHFNDLRSDLAGQMRRVADFIGVNVDPATWPTLVEHCTFDYMKSKAGAVAPIGATFMTEGRQAFFHKGTNGRWRELLSAEEAKKYEDMAVAKLTSDCAHWLATGEQLD